MEQKENKDNANYQSKSSEIVKLNYQKSTDTQETLPNNFRFNTEKEFETLYDAKTKKLPQKLFGYYIVQKVNESQSQSKKILICQKFINYFGEEKEEYIDSIISIQLEGIWALTLVNPFDKVFISAQFDNSQKKYVVKVNTLDNKAKNNFGVVKEFLKGFIIVNPDIYINPTYIKYCKKCVRGAFFSSCIRSVFDTDITLYTLVGMIIHELFEELLSLIKRENGNFEKDNNMYSVYNEQFKKEMAFETLKNIIKKEDYKYQASLIDVSEEMLIKECKPFINSIKIFFEDYVLNYQETKKLNIDKDYKNGIKVINFKSSEHKIFSPILGIDGIIDVYVELQEGDRKFFSVLEIKTGEMKSYTLNNDAPQILLYSLLLCQCYNVDSDKGLLIYLRNGLNKNNKYKMVHLIDFMPQEVAGSLIKRNELSHYYKNKIIEDNDNKNNKYLKLLTNHKIFKLNVPPVLDEYLDEGKRFSCDTCFKKSLCNVFYHLREEDSDKYDLKTKKYFNFFYNILNNEYDYDSKLCHLDNFNSMNNFINFEIKDIIQDENGSYLQITFREIPVISYEIDSDESSITQKMIGKESFYGRKKYVIYLEKKKEKEKEKKYLLGFKIYSDEKKREIVLIIPSVYFTPWNFNDSQNNIIKDYINFFANISKKVAIKPFNILNDYSYSLELGNLISFVGQPKNERLIDALKKIKTTIDDIKKKYIKSNKNKTNNQQEIDDIKMDLEKEELNEKKITIQIEENDRVKELQSYLLGDNPKKPMFYGTKENIKNLFKYFVKNSPLYLEEYDQLNPEQKKAFIFANVAQKYLLIQGFPGSGKSFFISYLIQGLEIRNLKIVFVAQTNIAVDNICLRLKTKNINFIRIAPVENNLVHNEIKPYILDIRKFNKINDYKNYITSTKIFATTAASIGNKIFQNLRFDYGIFDEACQCFEPELLGPLLLCEKFILVGDPKQLSAPLKSVTQEEKIPTLFEKLAEKFSNALIKFTVQYRMNEEISDLSSQCVYDGKMKCAKFNKNSKLYVNLKLSKNIKSNKIINNVLFKQIINSEKSVVFVDYKNMYSEEELKIVNYDNEYEVNIIKEILLCLKDVKFNFNDIGVITPYLKQEKLLKDKLSNIGFNNSYTIDKSQGSEKEIIIISFVKTYFNNSFINDMARINVAFTRAKTKLIIIGVKEALEQFENLKKYIKEIEDKKCLFDLKLGKFI